MERSYGLVYSQRVLLRLTETGLAAPGGLRAGAAARHARVARAPAVLRSPRRRSRRHRAAGPGESEGVLRSGLVRAQRGRRLSAAGPGSEPPRPPGAREAPRARAPQARHHGRAGRGGAARAGRPRASRSRATCAMGKVIELEVEAATADERGDRAERDVRRLLANPVLEDYAIDAMGRALARTGPSEASRGGALRERRRRLHEFGVVVFPGTWSDCDFHYVISEVLGQPVKYLWHPRSESRDLDCVILPGGFSYGDYLRAGAMAGRSPVVEALPRVPAARRVRARLVQRLPDPVRGRAPARRADAQRVPAVPLPVDVPPGGERRHALHARDAAGPGPPHADLARRGQVLRRSRDPPGAARERGQIVFRYATADGRVTKAANPNGSLDNIAGIVNEGGHGSRAHAAPRAGGRGAMGGTDGLLLFHSLLGGLGRGRARSASVEPRHGDSQPQGHARAGARASGLTAEEYDAHHRSGSVASRRITELGLFSALWSEHCAYKHSRVFLRRLPRDGRARAAGPG